MAPPMAFAPITFDRAMEGFPISASSILFLIPTEILEVIVGYVASGKDHKEHLASLALVNPTFRQLARSYQFCSTVLDCSPAGLEGLAVLEKEAAQKGESFEGVKRSPSVGVCIRQLKISAAGFSPPLWPSMPPDRSSKRVRDLKSKTETVRRPGTLLSQQTSNLFWPTVFQVLPTLPNLQSLSLASIELDDELLDCLAQLHIKNLELDGQFQRRPKIRTRGRSCPLETLSISGCWDARYAAHQRDNLDSSSFYQALLETCCLSLRSLELTQTNRISDVITSPISFQVEFPKLEVLHIGEIRVDGRAVCRLVREGLSSLFIPFGYSIALGQIHTLETIGIFYGDNDPMSLSFIESNTQIGSLAICNHHEDAYLRRLMLLLHHHQNLKVLSLIWQESDIPEASLNELSLLSQVEVLHISAGGAFVGLRDWFINHDEFRAHLSSLVNLRRLIIQHDIYSLSFGAIDRDPMAYYRQRPPGPPGAPWPAHETIMLEHAAAYVRVLPRLEFIVIGQIIFTVVNHNGVREPVVSRSAWADEGEYDVLKEEFGLCSTWPLARAL
ncbi:hypothetical protein GGS24DRAFT_501661 [Hypoxylon argillaceum]|nr:hypothetical protein GGS24DRAFT_501661 [Hypoxylon argillaceum]